MSHEEQSRGVAPDEAAITAAHAIYTPFMLSFYDRLLPMAEAVVKTARVKDKAADS